MKRINKLVLTVLAVCYFQLSLFSQDLYEKFISPSNDTKVSTYWFWLSGHVSKSGIDKDLLAMKNSGIGSFVLLNGGLYPFYGDVNFGTDIWWNHLSYAMTKADSLGLKFGIYNSDGWSMSGGPWIEVEKSMKMVTSTDTIVKGGQILDMKLPQPAYNIMYEDVAVMAYPTLPKARSIAAKVTSLSNVDNPNALFDENKKTSGIFNYTKNRLPEIVLNLGTPRKLRRIEVDEVKADAFLNSMAILEYSADGKNFRKIEGDFPLCLKSETSNKTITFSFPEVIVQYVRISVDIEYEGITPVPTTQPNIQIAEIRFFETAKVGIWEAKSAVTKRIRHDRQQQFQREINSVTNEDLPNGEFIDKKQIIDLTKYVSTDGKLKWKVPEGSWTILRTGYTSTLRKVGPASPQGRGYECDKLDSEAVKVHFMNYTDRVNNLSLKLIGKPLHVVQMESWEAGIQNWTKGFEKEFEKRNGYSIIPWLPVMTMGLIVDSYETSNRFLWDLRKTISEMMAENYWGTFYKLCNERGILVQNEASGMQQFLYDPINYIQYSDKPMGEFWTSEGVVRADCKHAASIAHLRGLNLVSGEAFTGSGDKLWCVAPYDFKQIGDEAFTIGVNNFVLHCYVHQPYDVKPGITLQRFGNHFQRLNPWFNYSYGWMSYLQKCQSLLQEGQLAADVCYFTGEGIPSYLGLRDELNPALPAGYDYDGVNLDFICRMNVKNGNLVLPNGVSYKLMVIREQEKLTPKMVSEIGRLVYAGATVVANKPKSSPSLSNYPACDAEVKLLGKKLWGIDFDGITVTRKKYGKGELIWGIPLQKLLNEKKVLSDFAYTIVPNRQNIKINYIHRRTNDAEIYFLANYNKDKAMVNCSFRVSGRKPQLWRPDTGEIFDLDYKDNEGMVNMDLSFGPLESYFIVFRNELVPNAASYMKSSTVNEKMIDKGWNVEFIEEPVNGLNVQSTDLFDWSTSTNDMIKYYSGAAVYTNSFKLKNVSNRQFMLDLGKVGNIAVVSVNGQEVMNLWKPPYRVDITKYVKKGINEIEVKVVNTSINQILGDERYPNDITYTLRGTLTEFPNWLNNPKARESQRRLFISFNYPVADKKVQSSGLIGPIILQELK